MPINYLPPSTKNLWFSEKSDLWCRQTLKSMMKKMIFEAMEMWGREFSAITPDNIAALYAPDASLWGTLSSTRRANPQSILDYFEQAFLFKDRKVTFDDSSIRCYGNLAINSGSYTFSLIKDGEKVVIPSRYSFTYIKRNGHWLIIEHHSSATPSD